MSAERWSERWRVVAPGGARAVEVRAGRRSRRLLAQELAGMVSGEALVLRDARRGSRRRCRRIARKAGLKVQRELIALPSLERSAFLVEDDPASVRFAWTSLVTVPPGTARGHAGAGVVIGVAKRLPWPLLGALAAGRVVVVSKP